MPAERIDKIISSSTLYSRKDVKNLIRNGAVFADGSAVLSAADKLDPEKTVITVNGKRLNYRRFVYIMLNKPKGVVSATEGGGCATVVDLVSEELRARNIFPAGRLDKYTTGFILLTDDGEFAHNILSPAHHIEKTYILSANRKVTEEEKEKILVGMTVGGEKLLPAKLELLKDGENPQYEIKIKQGKYHQIKRMFSEFGNSVLELHRTAIGGLKLDKKLQPGDYRELTDEEIRKITKK